jgi:ankyrin repeat protein
MRTRRISLTVPVLFSVLALPLTAVCIALAAEPYAPLLSPDGHTPLTSAITRGDRQGIQNLLEKGAAVNEKGKVGDTPLLLAVSRDDLELARRLLEKGADPTIANTLGETPLHYAARNGNEAMLKLLLERGADPKAVAKNGATVLMSAAAGGDILCVRTLLERGLPVDARDDFGRTALLEARGPQAAEIVRALVEKGADVNASDKTGCTALMRMALIGDREAAEILLAHGAKPDAKDRQGRTALTRAAALGHRALAERLKARGGGSETVSAAVRLAYLRNSVRTSLALLQSSAAGFQSQMAGACLSCHHQGIPALAVGLAREHGIAADSAGAGKQSEYILQVMEAREKSGFKQTDGEDPAVQCGYMLLALESEGRKRDTLTGKIALYAAKKQAKDGHWHSAGSNRPPSEGSPFTATALMLRGLKVYAPQDHAQETADQIALAKDWLRKTAPRTTEDRTFRLLGMAWAGVPKDDGDIQSAVKTLLAEQREDGGWSQQSDLKSDSYATGQALVALHLAGGLSTDDPAYRRGVDYLLQTRAEDGSWFVPSRSFPFQPYIETRFTYGKDQFISICGTSWATAALALAIPLSR